MLLHYVMMPEFILRVTVIASFTLVQTISIAKELPIPKRVDNVLRFPRFSQVNDSALSDLAILPARETVPEHENAVTGTPPRHRSLSPRRLSAESNDPRDNLLEKKSRS